MRIGCIICGSSPTLGAVSIPATAPSTAARPQPSASIQVTRTPTSRASAGLTAAARSASPTFVNRKRSQRRTTIPSVTAIVPMSCTETTTPPMSNVSVPNGLLSDCGSPLHCQTTKPLIAISSPIVTITTRSTFPRSTGRITAR